MSEFDDMGDASFICEHCGFVSPWADVGESDDGNGSPVCPECDCSPAEDYY